MMTPSLDPRYSLALTYACDLHRDQYRKGSGIPYITHLMAVSAYVFEFGGTVDQAIAGLLHDSIEDQADRTSLSEIEKRFGKQVAEIVEACTDSVVIPKPSWEVRKAQYLQNLSKKPDFIRLVVACDKLHNAECIVRDVRLYGKEVWTRFGATPDRILWYYQGLVESLSSFNSPVVSLLKTKVKEMESLI